MSPSKRTGGPKRPRKRTSLHRPGPTPTRAPVRPPAPPPPPAPGSGLAPHLLALEALGWRVVELRPTSTTSRPAIWRAAILRTDLDATMSVSAPDPAVALAELVRYASADARGRR